jgi:hypothetical protein
MGVERMDAREPVHVMEQRCADAGRALSMLAAEVAAGAPPGQIEQSDLLGAWR